MKRRDTGTGRVLEQMVLPALRRGGYDLRAQTMVGERLGGGAHVVDGIVVKDARTLLLSLKWQQVAGTAEQKVPFEVICLAEAVLRGNFDVAYLVLGGDGWKLRTFYTDGGLNRDLHLRHAESVHIVTLERFVALANQGQL